MEILEIITKIQNTSGTNDKVEVLAEHKDNELLKRILKNTYSPFCRFYIKKMPNHSSSETDTISLQEAVETVEQLMEVRGHAGRDILVSVLNKVTPETGELIKNMVKGSLKGGFGRTMINKVMGRGFIKKEPYMGAKSFSVKGVEALIKSGKKLVSQLKVDGRYANVNVMTSGVVKADSRQGHHNYFSDALDFLAPMAVYMNMDIVLNGELTLVGFTREKGNGVINAMIRVGELIETNGDWEKELAKLEGKVGLTYGELLKRLRFTVWDYIPRDVYLNESSWNVPYVKRLDDLNKMVDCLGEQEFVEVVETREVSTAQEALDHFYEMVNVYGLEGTILKSVEDGWKEGKPSYQIKFKQEISLDLLVVDYQYGEEGKANEHLVSSLIVESSDGLLKARVSNMTQSLMKEITKNPEGLKGKIVEVVCSGLSEVNENEWVGVMHPRFASFRDDTTVKSLDECREIDSAARILSNGDV